MNEKAFKQQLLDALYLPYKKCIACPLGTLGRKSIVFGQGNPDADLMFIGEGPGQEEDLQGVPFVGRSGQLLNRVLEIIGLKRENVFITNIVKCRPPDNRKPTPEESMTCKDLLLKKQIQIIRPQVICTLGAAAIQGLLNKYDLKITKVRGNEYTYEDTRVLPTYHPAYVLRNPKELQTLVKDVKTAIEWLQNPPK